MPDVHITVALSASVSVPTEIASVTIPCLGGLQLPPGIFTAITEFATTSAGPFKSLCTPAAAGAVWQGDSWAGFIVPARYCRINLGGPQTTVRSFMLSVP